MNCIHDNFRARLGTVELTSHRKLSFNDCPLMSGQLVLRLVKSGTVSTILLYNFFAIHGRIFNKVYLVVVK